MPLLTQRAPTPKGPIDRPEVAHTGSQVMYPGSEVMLTGSGVAELSSPHSHSGGSAMPLRFRDRPPTPRSSDAQTSTRAITERAPTPRGGAGEGGVRMGERTPTPRSGDRTPTPKTVAGAQTSDPSMPPPVPQMRSLPRIGGITR
jgi:hypothetical protein